jgi:hypothetical protein
MAKGAATEQALAGLHATVARVIAEQLGETLVLNQDEVDAGEAEAERMYTASPALLTVAARFLKDNDVTADVGESADGMSAIEKKLGELKKHRGKVISLADLQPVAQDG